MAARSQALIACLMCLACGGHTESANGNGAPSEPTEQAGAAAMPETNGGAGAASDAGAGGADAGAPGYVPSIESGTRNCENADYCFGLECYAPPSFQPLVCVARCDSDADCAANEACVGSSVLEPTCYARCDSPRDCAYHFDCFDFDGQGELVCLPAWWATRRAELGN